MKSFQIKTEADEPRMGEKPGFQRNTITTLLPKKNASALLISTIARESFCRNVFRAPLKNQQESSRFQEIKNPFRRPPEKNVNPFRSPRGK